MCVNCDGGNGLPYVYFQDALNAVYTSSCLLEHRMLTAVVNKAQEHHSINRTVHEASAWS